MTTMTKKYSTPPDPDQLSLPVEQTAALARKSDPATSHAAARAQTAAKLRASHRRVLVLFAKYGSMDDRTLREMAKSEHWTISDSGLRTRRAELCAPRRVPALIEPAEREVRYENGTHGTVWQLTAEGRKEVGA